jgi:hypothetical protein
MASKKTITPRTGRPPLPPSCRATVSVTFRLTPGSARELDDLVASLGPDATRSRAIVEAIHQMAVRTRKASS